MAAVVGHRCDQSTCNKFETVEVTRSSQTGHTPDRWFKIIMPTVAADRDTEHSREFCSELCVIKFMKERHADLYGKPNNASSAPRSKVEPMILAYLAAQGVTGSLIGGSIGSHKRFHQTEAKPGCHLCEFDTLSDAEKAAYVDVPA